MSDKTFKQQVAPYVCIWGENYMGEDRSHCRYCPQYWEAKCKDIEAILSAHNAELDRIAERMPKPKNYYETHDWYVNGESATHIARTSTQLGIDGTHSTIQAYLQAQKGS